MTSPTQQHVTSIMRREAMDQVKSYNSRLLLERRLRMPYIDSQTGLAQQDCRLWVSRVQRCSPVREGQVYSYLSHRWRARRRPDFTGTKPQAESQTIAVDKGKEDGERTTPEEVRESGTSSASNLGSQETEFYTDEQFDSDFDSEEDRRKRRKSKFKGKKNALALKLADKIPQLTKEDINKMSPEDRKKPYGCQICTRRYKNQQGLRYHYEHHNHEIPDDPMTTAEATPPAVESVARTPVQLAVSGEPSVATPLVKEESSNGGPPADHVTGMKRQKGMPPSTYCDFCLGNTDQNKKIGGSEELISCADCGRSGHPSCLQFNLNLTTQVKMYKWQCIECKCCCVCGTSDNDEQLLFCDDCDRGYHMYCLVPPIDEPPEGSWQCQLCGARVRGEDVSKVAVLPQHMDVSRVPIKVEKNVANAVKNEVAIAVRNDAQNPVKNGAQNVSASVSPSVNPLLTGKAE